MEIKTKREAEIARQAFVDGIGHEQASGACITTCEARREAQRLYPDPVRPRVLHLKRSGVWLRCHKGVLEISHLDPVKRDDVWSSCLFQPGDIEDIAHLIANPTEPILEGEENV